MQRSCACGTPITLSILGGFHKMNVTDSSFLESMLAEYHPEQQAYVSDGILARATIRGNTENPSAVPLTHWHIVPSWPIYKALSHCEVTVIPHDVDNSH